MSKSKLKRTKKIVLVAHCLLNANSKVEGLEEFEALSQELLNFILKNDYGIIQLPCPEIQAGGIKRWGMVREQYDNPFYHKLCRKILKPIIEQIEDYIKNDYKIAAIIGVEKSPSCGVKLSCSAADWGGSLSDLGQKENCKFINENGIFIKIIKEELEKRDIKIPLYGIDEENIKESIKNLKKFNKLYN